MHPLTEESTNLGSYGNYFQVRRPNRKRVPCICTTSLPAVSPFTATHISIWDVFYSITQRSFTWSLGDLKVFSRECWSAKPTLSTQNRDLDLLFVQRKTENSKMTTCIRFNTNTCLLYQGKDCILRVTRSMKKMLCNERFNNVLKLNVGQLL